MKPGEVKTFTLKNYGQSKPILDRVQLESRYPMNVIVEVKNELSGVAGEVRPIRITLSSIDTNIVPAGYEWDLKIEERSSGNVIKLIDDHLKCNPRGVYGLSHVVQSTIGSTLVLTVSAPPGVTKGLLKKVYYPRLTLRAYAA